MAFLSSIINIAFHFSLALGLNELLRLTGHIKSVEIILIYLLALNFKNTYSMVNFINTYIENPEETEKYMRNLIKKEKK